MKALIIIDMQKGCVTPYSGCYDLPGVTARINTLAEKFRAKQYPVILVQHDGSSENCLLPDTDDWHLIPELVVAPHDIRLNKTANDSFYGTSLQSILSQKQVTEIYLAGYSSDFCIDVTAKSALSKDYKVTVIADAHTTESKPHLDLDAHTIVKQFNWIWSVMPPAKEKLMVVNAGEVGV
ncbi:MAG TPA: isochorismatase family protein [Ohtaekwangia sp.]|uniref:isochorismatase family protein n=1 Tax=Ohtaekwangia sp. TaxID=2066019 RepID=UPI002F94563A